MIIPSSLQPPRAENDRIQEQARRHRLLSGGHREDIRAAIAEDFAPEIAAELSLSPDLSENPFRAVLSQLNTAYSEPPEVSMEGVAIQPETLEIISPPDLWARMRRRALYQLGIQECAVRLDWPSLADLADGARQEVLYRIVPPHLIWRAEGRRSSLDRLALVEELRLRYRETTEGRVPLWTLERWDIRDPAAPRYQILEVGDGEEVDITAEIDPENADNYPYLDADGVPILPYELYHAEIQSQLWNWTEGVELVEGTIKAAVGWSHWWVGYQTASHPQRWGMDVEVVGSELTPVPGGEAISVVKVDHRSVVLFGSTKGPGTGSLGQWQPAMDPVVGVDALRKYVERLAVFAGISPADLQITSGQSGYAIVVSRQGQREARARQEPALRVGDQRLLATAARMANAYHPARPSLPTDPRQWRITYHGLGESAEERKLRIENLSAEQALGLRSRVDLLRQLQPEIQTDEEAIEHLVQIALQDALLQQTIAARRAAVGLTPPPPPTTPAPMTEDEDV